MNYSISSKKKKIFKYSYINRKCYKKKQIYKTMSNNHIRYLMVLY